MARNSNPRTQSVKDQMLAEIIVTELSKFSTSHELIIESAEKIRSQYNDIGELIEQMDKRDRAITKSIQDLQSSAEQIRYRIELFKSVAGYFKEIEEHGISIESRALDKIVNAVNHGNKPLQKQFRRITYGMIGIMVILFLLVFF